MMTGALAWAALVLGCGAGNEAAADPARGGTRLAAELLPARTTVYLELRQPRRVLDILPLHWLDYESVDASESLGPLGDCECCLGFQAALSRPVLLVRPGETIDLDVLEHRAVEFFMRHVCRSNIALPADRAVPAETLHRGVRIRPSGPIASTQIGAWLVWAADPADLRAAIDRADGHEADSLATTSEFRDARRKLPQESPGTLFFRPEPLAAALRTGGVAAETQHPILNRLLDEFIRPLFASPYVALALDDRPGRPRLTFALPEELGTSSDGMRLAAALIEQGQAFAPLLPRETVVSVSAYLSHDALGALSRLLLAPDVLKRLAGDHPDLALMLAGLPLFEQIVGEMRPEVQFVVARRPGESLPESPGIAIPAMAVIFRPEHPAQVKSAFILTYLGMVRQANQQARREGRPTFIVKSQRRGEALVTGAVRTAAESRPSPGGWLDAAIAPSMAVCGQRFIFATSYDLAVELADLAAENEIDVPLDDSLRIDLGPAAALGLLADGIAGLNESKARHTSQAGESPLAEWMNQVLERFPRRTVELPSAGRLAPLRTRILLRTDRRTGEL